MLGGMMAAMLALGVAAPATGHACQPPQAQVSALYSAPWIGYLPISELNKKYRRPGDHPWLGSTAMRLQAEVSIYANHQGIIFPSCSENTMDIVVSLIEHEVTLAEELKALPCTHKTVREHEEKHVALNKRMLQEMKPLIASYANKRLSAIMENTPQQEQLAIMQRFVATELQEVIDRSRDQFSTQQAALDTPEEYDRIRTACASEMDQLGQIILQLEQPATSQVSKHPARH